MKFWKNADRKHQIEFYHEKSIRKFVNIYPMLFELPKNYADMNHEELDKIRGLVKELAKHEIRRMEQTDPAYLERKRAAKKLKEKRNFLAIKF